MKTFSGSSSNSTAATKSKLSPFSIFTNGTPSSRSAEMSLTSPSSSSPPSRFRSLRSSKYFLPFLLIFIIIFILFFFSLIFQYHFVIGSTENLNGNYQVGTVSGNEETFVISHFNYNNLLKQIIKLQKNLDEKNEIIDNLQGKSNKNTLGNGGENEAEKDGKTNPIAKAEEKIQILTSPSPSASLSLSLLPSPPSTSPLSSSIPILLFTCNRASNLRRTLDSLLQFHPQYASPPLPSTKIKLSDFPIVISQDCGEVETTDVIKEYQRKHPSITHIQHQWKSPPLTSDRMVIHRNPEIIPSVHFEEHFSVYFKIANHYDFALSHVFDTMQFHRVIIVEDDFQVSPDFYHYFQHMSTIYDSDPSVYCVSAWNDNGVGKFVSDGNQFHRTECFPGLGWMMNKRIWEEMKPKWPVGFWDDWLREPEQRRNRSCIYPEINRVYTFGSKGASGGLFFDQFLSGIKLYEQTNDYSTLSSSLDYLRSPEQYDDYLRSILANATEISSTDSIISGDSLHPHHEYVFYYQYEYKVGGVNGASDVIGKLDPNRRELQKLQLGDLSTVMGKLGLMNDHKAGIPRTSNHFIVNFRAGKMDNGIGGGGEQKRARVWLVPKQLDWKTWMIRQ